MRPISDVLKQAQHARTRLPALTAEQRRDAVHYLADLLRTHQGELLSANHRDRIATDTSGISSALASRLTLTDEKLTPLISGLHQLADLPDPVGRVLRHTQLDNGLVLTQQTMPLGVITVIFEARPDVLPQIAALCLKSGNVVILKGGRECSHTHHAMMGVLAQLRHVCPWLPEGWVQLVDGREAVAELLRHPEVIDLVIPRGSNELVRQIMRQTSIPVLGHADGVCHMYLHASARLANALPVLLDAKTQYPAACNALETVLVDAVIAPDWLPGIVTACKKMGIQLKGCPLTQRYVSGLLPVEDWHMEHGDLTLAICVVEGLDQAIEHINTYGSHHTDAIMADDPNAIETFFNRVDSASVFANASTRFADGYRYGLGAEVGISTSRTHARGPVGLEGLLTTQWRLEGQGHCVADYVGPQARSFLHQPANR